MALVALPVGAKVALRSTETSARGIHGEKGLKASTDTSEGCAHSGHEAEGHHAALDRRGVRRGSPVGHVKRTGRAIQVASSPEVRERVALRRRNLLQRVHLDAASRSKAVL